jgi:N-acetylglucosamine-6-phosphate deacetylase
MIVLSGADLVLPTGVQREGTLVIEGERITDIRAAAGGGGSHPLRDHLIVPGFVDVHVHGTGGVDTLEGNDAVRKLAHELPKYGVTAFCPTSVACSTAALTEMLGSVAQLRRAPGAGARVLAAHLESNFINPEFTGAQPMERL